MGKFKKFLLGSAALLTIGTLSACGDTSAEDSSKEDGDKIGVAFYKYDDTYISSVRQALEEASKDNKDVELLMNDSKGDQATQNDQMMF